MHLVFAEELCKKTTFGHWCLQVSHRITHSWFKIGLGDKSSSAKMDGFGSALEAAAAMEAPMVKA